MDELDELFSDEALAPALDALRGVVSLWVPVEGSTNVRAVTFQPDGRGQGVLAMRFVNGGEYHYLGVPQEVYDALLSTRSKGSTHWDQVRRAGYTFRCVTKPRANWRDAQ